ncbi:glycosyltransferase [Patulibacter brassicae]|uniref:Glycosyltransferase n=1 Tax=Patulibacter brassicae TaxID=1705717 RepID=A0ABU4VJA6_9ACTN|nr:glycosyltransferase [Patulibacter brassicae]MDX8150993.1 glycosyltransferase [Patulibacter brassicae]
MAYAPQRSPIASSLVEQDEPLDPGGGAVVDGGGFGALPRSRDARGSQAVLTRAHWLAYAALTGLWAVVNVSFWAWWIPRMAEGWLPLGIVVTVALTYTALFLPSVFWWFIARMRRPAPAFAPSAAGTRVAMVTLCVPAVEALEVIEEQLAALAAVRYPHDSWVLDEGGSPAVRALADRYGVRYFTRAGVARWNQPAPPWQAKTKAGNVNAWLDHLDALGEDYDYFVQMDVDHHPEPSYLDAVLGQFDDPQVGWVQAPSVGGNLERWTARGLAEHELVLQGPLQMGFYGNSRTPFIIGSHTTYRTSAVREIGGFQPTRAEDHLDTVVLAAHGYRGVYHPEIIATGDGPDTLATYLRQQFAWAHSMITVCLRWTPRLLPRYTAGQALQFLFSQSWYLLWGLSMLVLWLAPTVALATEHRIATVQLGTYLIYFLPVALTAHLMWGFARSWFQPQGIGLSWRGAVLMVARWPVVLWAVLSVVLRLQHSYMITPKTRSASPAAAAPPGRLGIVYGPLVALVALPLAVLWVVELTGRTAMLPHYAGLVLLNALVPLVVLLVALLLEVRDHARRGVGLRAATRGHAPVVVATVVLVAGLAVTTAHLAAVAVEGMT